MSSTVPQVKSLLAEVDNVLSVYDPLEVLSILVTAGELLYCVRMGSTGVQH